MARMIYGIGGQSIVFNFSDSITRTVQEVIFDQLANQRSLYFRAPGLVSGEDVHNTVLIGASSSLAFQYDVAVLPAVDEKLRRILDISARCFGGISLGGDGVPEDSFDSLVGEADAAEFAE